MCIRDRYFFSLYFHHSVTLFWLLLARATAATEMVDSAPSVAGVSPVGSSRGNVET